MNYQLLLKELNQFTTNELIYRDLFFAKNDPIHTSELLSYLDKKKILENHIILPDYIAESVPGYDYWSNDNLFKLQKNVKLIKHDRYTPVFTHHHDFFEIIYVLSGTCIQNIGSTTFSLKNGDICFLGIHSEHSISVTDDKSIIINILVRRDTFLDIFLNAIRDKSNIASFFLDSLYSRNNIAYMLYHTENNLDIRDSILQMYLEQIVDDEFSDRIISNMLCIFFSQLNRLYSRTMEINTSSTANHMNDKLKILNYIHENYSTVTLHSLAKHFHYSEAYCSRLVKKLSGLSFSDLISGIRLQWGENMLLKTPMSIAAISEHLGYENTETFIRMFKRMHGITPNQFRQNHIRVSTSIL